MNDPAGIALMLGMIEFATHANSSLLVVLREFAVEMAVGTATGVLGAYLLVWLLRRIALENDALYPVLALVLAVLLYGATALLHGSGFLAVFIAGILLGDVRAPYKREIERFHNSLASLAELTVFVALGLTVTVATLNGRTWVEGLVLFLAVAVVARPLAVAAFLAPFKLRNGERAFIAWCGLKGAVPILLAAFALIDHVKNAGHVYGIVFIVVLLSVVGQGTLVPQVAAILKVPVRRQPVLPWELSMRLEEQPHPAREFVVRRGSRAEGSLIRNLPLGPRAWVTLVVRAGIPVRPGGSLTLEADDRVQVLSGSDDLEALATLFSNKAQVTFARGRPKAVRPLGFVRSFLASRSVFGYSRALAARSACRRVIERMRAISSSAPWRDEVVVSSRFQRGHAFVPRVSPRAADQDGDPRISMGVRSGRRLLFCSCRYSSRGPLPPGGLLSPRGVAEGRPARRARPRRSSSDPRARC